jgi:hypothetical protein
MGAPYLGETLTCRVRATDPVTAAIVTDATGTAYFFAPPKDPQTNPSDRTDPDFTLALTFDPVSRYYLANFSTEGAPWVSGTWWFQPVVAGGAGGYNGWDYFSFTLSE